MNKIRISSLDGLRGLAILAVILTHVPNTVLYASVATVWHPFLGVITGSGKTGVSILFLLTGFLMAWLYPDPQSTLSFWAKRYARLFPPFLVMVVSLSLIRSAHGMLPIPIEIGIILLACEFGRRLWKYSIKKSKDGSFGKKLITSFLLFQGVVALGYIALVTYVPPAVYYELWPKGAQWVAVCLVNATLTLPFGRYIGQLDGVYWSLVTETLFYLLYPLLFIPIVKIVRQKKSLMMTGLIIASTVPFSFALKLIGDRILGIGMLGPHFLTFFVIGVALGASLPWLQAKMSKMPALCFHPLAIIPILIIGFSSVLSGKYFSEFYLPLLQLIWAFPLGIMVILLIEGEKRGRKWLQQPWLTWLGKYSYSLYLTHSIVIEWVGKSIKPDTFITNIVVIVGSILGSAVLAKILYEFVEKSYYTMQKSTTSLHIPVTTRMPSSIIFNLTFSVVVILLLLIAYRPPTALLTSTKPHHPASLSRYLQGDSKTFLSETVTRYNFVGNDDNLGMITSHIRVKPIAGVTNISSEPSILYMRLFDENHTLLAESAYKTFEIGNSNFHPFGFPIQTASKNKSYSLEYQLKLTDAGATTELITTEGEFMTVYFPAKKELLSNPKKLFSWLIKKVSEPLNTSPFWFTLILVSPLIITLWLALIPRRSFRV